MKSFIGRAITKIRATSKRVPIYFLVSVITVVCKPFLPQWVVIILELFKIVSSLLYTRN